MRGKLGFVIRFLSAFALLIVLGWATDAPARYAQVLRGSAALLSPVTTGWWIEMHPGPKGLETVFRRGEHSLPLLLSLDSLALGLLPLVSLLSATPGLSPARRFLTIVLGVAGLFLLDLIIVLLYPLLVNNPNPVTDIVGMFLGLLTFVGGPIILWFILTFRELRPIWGLDTGRSAFRPGAADRKAGGERR